MTEESLSPVSEMMAQSLIAAHGTGMSVPRNGDDTPVPFDEAYPGQRAVFAAMWGQNRVAGYKVSLVAQEHRDMFGAGEPTFGRLPAVHIIPGAPDVALCSLRNPLVEPELVFRVVEDIPATATVEQIAASTTVAAGIEVSESRLVRTSPEKRSLPDMVFDNSAAGRIVHATRWTRSDTMDLAAIDVSLAIDGQAVASGSGASVLGNPLNAVAWLVEALGRESRTLRAGDRISSGTFTRPEVAREGTFTAEFSGIGTAQVTFT